MREVPVRGWAVSRAGAWGAYDTRAGVAPRNATKAATGSENQTRSMI
jgi:hypothetical protein